MELLLSNYPPVRGGGFTFSDYFIQAAANARSIQIASGYISTDGLAELNKIIQENGMPRLSLVIGMHYFEGFTRPQYDAALVLAAFLKEHSLGDVYVATSFKYHGKVYCFSDSDTPMSCIIGSSNISNLLAGSRVYETDIAISDKRVASQVQEFLENLREKASKPLSYLELETLRFKQTNKLLEDHTDVEELDPVEYANILSRRTGLRFEIPLKDTPRSNLNVYHGKGRENKKGIVKPRHWYEVEIIVPKSITSHPQYPKAGYPDRESVINVVTDDLWKFKCKISGDYSKNFRSAEGLTTLGRWIKGRLENYGSLKAGEYVTKDVFRHYGRDTLELSATNDPNLWVLDFSNK